MQAAPRPLAIVLALAVVGCLNVLKAKDSKPEIEPGHAGYETTVQVKFLGVGGFSVRLGPDVFMTAPMYSNPFAADLVPPEKPISPDPKRIACYHHPTLFPREIQAILVGHAHYDHLMDLLPIWRGMAHRPPIYGSLGMRNILAGYDRMDGPVQAGATVVLDDLADYRQCHLPQPCEGCAPESICPAHEPVSGTWTRVPGSRIRLMALCAGHPKQILGQHLWAGCVKTPRTEPPEYSCDFKEGQVFSYLVDFLDGSGRPIFRTYYQDTPADATAGWGTIPADLLIERHIDLMLLCGGNWHEFDHSELVARDTGVRHVVLGHWEDFFLPQSVPTHEIPFMKVDHYVKLLKRVSGLEVLVPEAQAMMHFPLEW